MPLELVPQSLYSLSNVKILLSDNESSILYKELRENITNVEVYIKTPLIIFVDKGQQVISHRDGTNITVNRHEAVFLPKDIYVASDLVIDADLFRSFMFFIDKKLIDQFLLWAEFSGEKHFTSAHEPIHIFKAKSQIVKYMNSLLSVYGETKNCPRLLELKLLELLQLIYAQDKDGRFLSSLSSFIKSSGIKRDIGCFMEQYCFKNLKLEDYAFLTGRSVSTFIRDFKKTYNTTPNRWLVSKRLERARELLIDNGWSVTNVAMEVGYENISHFIRAYKDKYGLTPNKDKQHLNP